jgi:hypothetical protein
MGRRVISAIAIVACTGLYALAAAERANFILTNGDRKSGTVVAHGDQHENLINGFLNLGQDGAKDLTFPVDQVAVIDFTAERRPQQTELAQLPPSGQLLVLRNGTSQPGRFVNLINGDTLIWENAGGQRQQYAIRDVGRVYLNADNARTAFGYTGTRANANVVGTAGTAARTIQVAANQSWTDTGIDVNQGDRVVFQASGQITWDRNAGQTATPDGSGTQQRTGLPLATAPVGALIGRVGNSAPFGIGTQTQPLVMPAAGRLMLGVNDSVVADNAGAFSVVVAKQ